MLEDHQEQKDRLVQLLQTSDLDVARVKSKVSKRRLYRRLMVATAVVMLLAGSLAALTFVGGRSPSRGSASPRAFSPTAASTFSDAPQLAETLAIQDGKLRLGGKGRNGEAAVWTRENGAWSEATLAPPSEFPPKVDLLGRSGSGVESMVTGPATLVSGHVQDSPTQPWHAAIWREDTTGWRQLELPGLPSDGSYSYLSSLVRTQSGYLSVGASARVVGDPTIGTVTFSCVLLAYASTDGSGWSRAAVDGEPDEANCKLALAVSEKKAPLVVNSSGTSVWTDEGGHWVKSSTSFEGTALDIHGLATASDHYVAVGSAQNRGTIWSSADGRQWQIVAQRHDASSYTSVATSHDGWTVAVGWRGPDGRSDGIATTSSDGASWAPDLLISNADISTIGHGGADHWIYGRRFASDGSGTITTAGTIWKL